MTMNVIIVRIRAFRISIEDRALSPVRLAKAGHHKPGINDPEWGTLHKKGWKPENNLWPSPVAERRKIFPGRTDIKACRGKTADGVQALECFSPAVKHIIICSVLGRVHLERIAHFQREPFEIFFPNPHISVVCTGIVVRFDNIVVRHIAPEVESPRAPMTGKIDKITGIGPVIGISAPFRAGKVLLPCITIPPVELARPSIMADKFVIESAGILVLAAKRVMAVILVYPFNSNSWHSSSPESGLILIRFRPVRTMPLLFFSNIYHFLLN
jgi:hypothetical protein